MGQLAKTLDYLSALNKSDFSLTIQVDSSLKDLRKHGDDRTATNYDLDDDVRRLSLAAYSLLHTVQPIRYLLIIQILKMRFLVQAPMALLLLLYNCSSTLIRHENAAVPQSSKAYAKFSNSSISSTIQAVPCQSYLKRYRPWSNLVFSLPLQWCCRAKSTR